MRGLDAWIEGDNVCSYCGAYACKGECCEPEPEEEEENEHQSSE